MSGSLEMVNLAREVQSRREILNFFNLWPLGFFASSPELSQWLGHLGSSNRSAKKRGWAIKPKLPSRQRHIESTTLIAGPISPPLTQEHPPPL